MPEVLIVDDDKMNCTLLQKTMKTLTTPDLAHDGFEALKLYYQRHRNKTPYQFIFLDLSMPNLGGSQTLQLIRLYEESFGITNFVKVIILTADQDKKTAMTLFKLGCEDYLTKPYQKEDVMNVFHKYDF